MKTKTLQVDWNQYREDFPSRYWSSSEIDSKFSQVLNLHLREIENPRILDVGGGVYGSYAINEYLLSNRAEVHLLDPFVENRPKGYASKVGYEDLQSQAPYDLILCRGAINYLSTEQINCLTKAITSSGLFIANTFILDNDFKESTKKVISSKYGEGLESAKLSEDAEPKVLHSLVYETEEVLININHEFYARTVDYWDNLGFSLVQYKNSAYLLTYRSCTI